MKRFRKGAEATALVAGLGWPLVLIFTTPWHGEGWVAVTASASALGVMWLFYRTRAE